jgi:quercetin dioxygenase-like cupin family protein
VRFKAHVQNGRKLRLVEFQPGFQEPDWCRNGHIGYVLEGEGEVEFSDQRLRVKAGDGIFILAGEQHKHRLHVLGRAVRFVLVEDVPAGGDGP